MGVKADNDSREEWGLCIERPVSVISLNGVIFQIY